MPVIRATTPSSRSASTKTVMTTVPQEQLAAGIEEQSAEATVPTVPIVVTTFGLIPRRASALPSGVKTRVTAGRRRFSIAL